jgi:hypothetical protein
MKFNPYFKLVSLFVLTGAFLIQSCIKEEYDFSKVSVRDWDPKLAIPLVNSTLTINDILLNADKQGAISVGSDGFCTLIYRGNLFSDEAGRFLNIPNQNLSPLSYSFSNTVSVGTFNAGNNGSNYGPYNQNGSYTLTSSYAIDSLYLKPGTTFRLAYNNTLPADLNINLTVNSLKDQNTAATFSKVISVPANTNSFVEYDLGGYLLNLNDGLGNRNILNLNYSLTMTKKGNASGAESISLTPSLNNIKFSTFIGSIGNLVNAISPYQDTISISIFRDASTLAGGTFTLVDPSVEAKITSYLGCNVKLTFDRLDAFTPDANNNNTNSNSLAGTATTQNITINGASSFSVPGFTDLIINKTNTSNVVPFINSQPKNVIYKVSAVTNPGLSGYVRNFFTDTSKFKVDFDIIMPMWGTAANFTLLDTIPVDLGDLSQINNITLRTYFNNEFPIDMGMEMDFVDSTYKTVFTFIPAGTTIIKGSSVDAVTGKLVKSTELRNDYIIDRSGIQNLKNVKKLIIKAKASTSKDAGGNQPNVKFYNFYKLNARVGLQVQPIINASTGK